MLQPTLVTWVLVFFGSITCGPLLYAQLVVLLQPHGQKARELMIGKGEEWRDKSHFKSAYGLAWADWIIFLPVFLSGVVGMVLGQTWGYVLFGAAGAIQLYINTFLWFFEKEYVYPAAGALAYYTYMWGNFMYWGTAAAVYAVLRLASVTL